MGWKLVTDMPTNDIYTHIYLSTYHLHAQMIFPKHALVHILDGNY